MKCMTHGLRAARSQRGVVLVVSLIFLVLLTLLAVSAIRLSNVNLRIAGNAQAQAESTAAAEQAVETILNSGSNFDPTPVGQTVTVDVNNDGTNDYTIVVPAPACLFQAPAAGWDTKTEGFAPKTGYYDVAATAVATSSGSTVTVHEGVRVNTSAGATCP